MAQPFQILSSSRIDRAKWERCIDSAENGLIYSRFDYLDFMCDHWSAIIVNDYDAVMPLPWRRKFGIKYIYQPAFIQQLGMVGNGVIDKEQLFAFAKYGDVLLNYQNDETARQWNAEQRSNLVIDLAARYETISANYKKDLVANLKKAEKAELKISLINDVHLAIRMYKLLYQQRMQGLTDTDYDRFEKLAWRLAAKDMCFTRTVTDEKQTVLAIGLFLKDSRRIYNLMNSTTDEGRAKEANHFLLDAVIKEFSGRKMLFDFEGSDVNGIKTFYEKFGAADQPYYFYHYNKLPALVQLFKR